MGIDHSNPYIHSTTVLCDYYAYNKSGGGDSGIGPLHIPATPYETLHLYWVVPVRI